MSNKMAISKNNYWMCVWGNNGPGRWVMPSNHFRLLQEDTGPFNFQSNELFLKFLRQQMAISKLKSDAFRENKRYVGGGIRPQVTLNLKKSTRTSDYKSNVPPTKLLRLPFLYIPYMPPGYNLQPLPWGLYNFWTFQLHWK